MKTRLLIILAFGLFSSSLLSIYAIPELDPETAFRYSEIVIVGKVLSVEILSEPQITKSENTYSERSGVALYEIQIEEYLKNPSDTKTITVPGYFLREPHPMTYETYPYDIDQRVLLYIQESFDENVVGDLIIRSGDSRVIDNGLCDLGSYFEKGLCVIIDDSTNTPDPSCKSGPSPGDNFVFVDCNWIEITCGPGTKLVDGVCIVINPELDPRLAPIVDYDYGLIYMTILLIMGIIAGVIGGIVFVIRRKRK